MRVIPDGGSGVWDTPGSWSAFVPLDTPRTNLARNSSAELSGSNQWFQGGASTAACVYPERSTARSWVGSASFKLGFTDPNDGPSEQIGFWIYPKEIGTYMVSYYMKKTGAIKNWETLFNYAADPLSANPNSAIVLWREWDHFDTSESSWFRFAFSIDVTDARPILVRIRGTVNNYPEVFTAYVDGILVEKANSVDDYFDGSITGAHWTGAPFASESVMDYEPKPLQDFGFTVQSVVGGNSMMWNTISTPLAFGGGYYQRSIPLMTDITLVGALESDGSRIDLERKRRALAKVLSPRYGIPVRLVYQPKSPLVAIDQLNTYAGAVMVEAVYTGGLEGNMTSVTREDAAINFRIHTPYMATSLNWNNFPISIDKTVPVGSGLMRIDPNGVYHAVLNPTTGYTTARARDASGVMYAAVQLNGTTCEVVQLDEQNGTTRELGTFVKTGGGNCQIYQIGFDPRGRLWAAGQFNQIEGVTKNVLAYWDGTTWTSPISSITEGYAVGYPYVSGFVFTDTELYIGGNFNNINGSAKKNWARFNAALGLLSGTSGPNGASGDTVSPLVSITKDQQDRLYVYGLFDGVGGNTAKNLWSFKPSSQTWEASFDFGQPASAEKVMGVEVQQNGTLLVYGTFTQIDGEAADKVVILKGLRSWQSVPIIGADPNYTPISAHQASDGSIHIAAQTTSTATVQTGGWVQLVNLSNVLRPEYRPTVDTAFDTFQSFTYIQPYPDGTIYLGGNPDSGATVFTVPDTNVITNNGDANAYPEIVFLGPLYPFRMTNHTTGKMMHFNLTLAQGDVATLKTGPAFSFVSKFKGDVSGSLLAGSQPIEFFLQPGDNYINVGADDYGSTDARMIFTWLDTYESVSAVWDE